MFACDTGTAYSPLDKIDIRHSLLTFQRSVFYSNVGEMILDLDQVESSRKVYLRRDPILPHNCGVRTMPANILVAIDGSPHAFKALDVAALLACEHQSKLTLLHVIPDVSLPPEMREWVRIQYVRGPEWMYDNAVAENILAAAQDRATANDVRSVSRRIEHGNPAKTILEVACDMKADAIVMGTRGFSDIKGLFMGSVAHKVTHGADCTVIIVK